MPGMRNIRGPLAFTDITVMKSGSSYTITNEAGLNVNKTSGSATAVTLPKTPQLGRTVIIKDGKRDAATNNITISTPDSSTIDGSSTLVISTNGGHVWLMYDGANWGTVA